MDRSINEKPLVLGLDHRVMVLLFTIGAVSFLSIGSIKIPFACLLVFIIARSICWYDPLAFFFIGSYLRLTDLGVSIKIPKSGKPFGDNLVWERPVGTFKSGIILCNTDGSYQISFKVAGIDVLSLPGQVLQKKLDLLNDAFKFLSEYSATLYWECKRTECKPAEVTIPTNTKVLPYALKLMEKEKQILMGYAKPYKNDYFITVLFKPESSEQRMSKFSGFFVQSEQDAPTDTANQDIEKFKEILGKFSNMISGAIELTALDKRNSARYLHSCVSTGTFDPCALQSCYDSDWAHLLPDQHFCKGLNPMLGDKYVKTIGIKGFPNDLSRMMRNDACKIPGELRWVTRIDLLCKEQAQKIVQSKRIAWANSSFNAGAMIASMFTGGSADNTIDRVSSRMADECMDISDELKEGRYTLANVTTSFFVVDEDEKKAVDQAGNIKKVLENHALSVHVEGVFTILCHWLNFRSYLAN